MAFLGKGKKEDLLLLASELEIVVESDIKSLSLKNKIIESSNYDEAFAKELFLSIVEERKIRERQIEEQKREEREKEKEEREKEKEDREYELERLKLEASLKVTDVTSENSSTRSKDMFGLIHRYDMKEDISLYLVLFERQAERAQISKEAWVTQLLGLLPQEITSLIVREPEEQAQDYDHIKEILLKRFKLTPEKFRQLFMKHQKSNDITWMDFYYELSNYFNGWLSGLKITTFDAVCNLFIADQIKKRAPYDFKEYYLDEWSNMNCPIKLAEKIEEFEDVRKIMKPRVFANQNKPKPYHQHSNQHQNFYKQRDHYRVEEKKTDQFKGEKRDYREPFVRKVFEKRRPLKCYECQSEDHLRPQCPLLKKPQNSVNNIAEVDSENELLNPYVLEGKVNGIKCKILRDTGATIDIVSQSYVTLEDMTGEHIWVQQPLDLTPTCLPIAKVLLECEMGIVQTKAAIITKSLDRGRYLLGNRTAALFRNNKMDKDKFTAEVNMVQTRRQKLVERKKEEKIDDEKNFFERDKKIVEEVKNLKTSENEDDESIQNIEKNITNEAQEKNDSLLLPDLVEDGDPLTALLKISQETFKEDQGKCEDLKPLFEQAEKEKNKEPDQVNYLMRNELLVKKKIDKVGNEKLLLVVPKVFREKIKSACHEGTSHLGVTKTKDRLSRHFYWPNCFKEIEDFVRSCDPCQRAGKAGEKKKAPMKLVPVISEVFMKINVDAVGPLPVTHSGKRYIITAMCMSSKYPDAVAVRDITSISVVDALLQIFSRMGFPKELQHDQGTSFMSALTSEFLEKFGVKVIHSSVYHPQSNPVERFHRTIKRILRVLCIEAAPDWEPHLHAALFALRTVTHESIGFSPAELVHGKNLRTPLTLLYENWLNPDEEQSSVAEYVFNLLNRLKRCQDLAVEKMKECQLKQKAWYDKNSVKREFKEGDQVLVLASSPANKLAVQWYGPGKIESKISDTNYIVSTPGRKEKSQIYHVNLLKPYYTRPELLNFVESENIDQPELYFDFPSIESNPNIFNFAEIVQEGHLEKNLDAHQIQQLQELLVKYSKSFSSKPGLTNIVEHNIELISDKPVRAKPYRMSPRQNEILKSEIQKMLQSQIIEIGVSDYTSPMILVEVPGRDPRPCIDYRKLNEIIKTEYFPLPNIEERVEIVSSAKYITILDLAKGYWQIPLSPEAQKYATFVTSFGSYRPLRMPFGLKNAPYFFSKMMTELLHGCESFAVPYLDDVAIFSCTWENHLKNLDEVLSRIQKANLKIKPSKCAFAQETVKYLGHVIGQGKRTPAELKIETIKEFPTPTSKSEIRAFLGLSGYYRRYIPNYSSIAAPLTEKLKGKTRKEKIVWTPECEKAFQELKLKLSSKPVLYSPDYKKEFLIQTDSSNEGTGVVLSQNNADGEEHPILYLSRKFSAAEKKFCTTEKECAAIVWAIKKLQCYLDGQNFTVQTDHNPLVWLNSNASTNPRLMRWALSLQPYNFKVKHRKGSLHINADVLSRMPNN